jgi:hypothetical protein
MYFGFVTRTLYFFIALGNYFSSHFIMGDQTFAGTQPECFLFGENNDLNYLTCRPVAVRKYRAFC